MREISQKRKDALLLEALREINPLDPTLKVESLYHKAIHTLYLAKLKKEKAPCLKTK